jgi:hypothetical protein
VPAKVVDRWIADAHNPNVGVGHMRQEFFARGENAIGNLVRLGIDIDGNDFALLVRL